MKSPPILVRVPPVFTFDAFSCWLGRLALSQGTSLSELCDFFEISLNVDLDRLVRGDFIARIRTTCQLPDSAFSVQERLMTAMAEIGPIGNGYLAVLRSKARFRFCIPCLQGMRDPYFPIHWRFVPWRWCPEHDCWLEDGCPHCNEPVLFPINQAMPGPKGIGRAFLVHCNFCGHKLTDREPCFLDGSHRTAPTEWEVTQARNGRALLAALYYGKFRVDDRRGQFELSGIARIQKRRAFSERFDAFSADIIRSRNVVGATACQTWRQPDAPSCNQRLSRIS